MVKIQRHQITLGALIVVPIFILIFWIVAKTTMMPESLVTESALDEGDSEMSTDVTDDLENVDSKDVVGEVSESECRVSLWSEWSNCSCVKGASNNIMIRTRTLRSGYNPHTYHPDPCSDIQPIQTKKCNERDCGKHEDCLIQPQQTCHESIDSDEMITFYHFNAKQGQCSLFEVHDCEDLDKIPNRFPTLRQCENVCYFSGTAMHDFNAVNDDDNENITNTKRHYG